jgi:hypothetical protein
MSEDPVLDKINEFLAERYKFFEDNVFPKILKIFNTILECEDFEKEYVKGTHECRFKMNDVKFKYRMYWYYADEKKELGNLYLVIKHRYRTVVDITYRSKVLTLDKFHECEWTELLDDIPDKIELIDKQLKEKRFQKYCKNFEKRCD